MAVEYMEKFYGRFSTFYDLIWDIKVFNGGRKLAPEFLDLTPGAQLLEVGVGTGLSIPVLPRSIEITGVDISQKMLIRARKRLDSVGARNVKLLKMDATQLEFPDNSFDRILAAYFISTVTDPAEVVQEMKRVCRPGGYLVFLNHFQSKLPAIGLLEKLLSPLFYLIGFQTGLNLHQLMADTGLEIEMTENIDFMGHWKAVKCVNPE